MTGTGGDYQLRSFRADGTRGESDPDAAAWLRAAALGFHQPAPSSEHLLRTIRAYESDGRVLTGVYVTDTPLFAWDAAHPVATYCTFVEAMNVGDGRMLDAHLIAGVTVRSSHRRRGLMREMISADLRRAASDGLAIAALSSMEATIYGRFGFGAATFTKQVEVDVGNKPFLTRAVDGIVEIADPAVLLGLAPAVFDRFHAVTLGSVQRPASYPAKISGAWAEDAPDPDWSVRSALHFDGNGDVDGYVTYKFSGWDIEPRTIEIVDIVASSPNASFGLWDYLASVDLVTRVRFGHASVTDALPWGMVDRRGFNVVGEEDGLWLRILDPVAALEARSYEGDGEVCIALSDPLDIAGGVYAVSVRDGRATVTAAPGDAVPDVSMDVSTLGSLYLGGSRADSLAQAGLITGSLPAIDALGALLAHRDVPYCITHF